MSFLHRAGPRNADTVHWVTEVCPSAYHKLNGRKVYIGYMKCKIREHETITQCFRCQGFGHTAAKCRAPKDLCRECAGEHDSRSCKSPVKKFVNCKGPYKASHAGCPKREAALRGILRSIDYGASTKQHDP